MRRKLNTPAIFLCALAMGAWVGASLHLSSQPITLTQSGATCQSCYNVLAFISKQSKKPQIVASNAIDRSACAVCVAGALVQDTPATSFAVSFETTTPSDTAPIMESVRLSAHTHSHPPERGPPA